MAVAGEPLGDSGHHAEVRWRRIDGTAGPVAPLSIAAVLGTEGVSPPEVPMPQREPHEPVRATEGAGHARHESGTSVARGSISRGRHSVTPWCRPDSHEVAPLGRLSPSAAQGIANRLMWKGWNLDRIARILEFAPFGFRNTRRVAQFAVSPQVSNEQIA